MGLIRILIILALAYLAWQLIKATLRRTGRLRGPGSGEAQSGEKMLPCAGCGVHVPSSEAFQYRDLAFCCQAHQQDYLADHRD